jgi:O-antigen/teichoic acid export membrane protein
VILFLDIVKHFIGSAYHSGLHVVPILLLANWLLGIYYNQSVWYKLADKTRYGMWLSFVGAAVTIVANLALIPWLGYAGSAWATLACYFTMVVLSYYWGQRHYPVPYRLGRITFYLLFALGIAAIEWQFLRELDTPAVWAIRLVLWLAYLAVGWWREKPRLSVT